MAKKLFYSSAYTLIKESYKKLIYQGMYTKQMHFNVITRQMINGN